MPQKNSRKRPWSHVNPSRGGPGILLTCESGRERKCWREAQALLQHFGPAAASKTTEQQSLDEEIASLKKAKPAFQEFETNCRGVVVLLYKPDDDDNTATTSHNWDPVALVHRILTAGTDDAPSSRFISRILPLQRTCYTNLDEIYETVLALLPPTNQQPTFAVYVKRRNCTTQLTTEAIIDKIATHCIQDLKWTVQLQEPDVEIWVEICQTLVGVSVLCGEATRKSWNLVQARAEKSIEKELSAEKEMSTDRKEEAASPAGEEEKEDK